VKGINPHFVAGSAVDHPAHYNTGKIEVIDAIEDWKLGFNLGNAVKYVARADHKGKKLEDFEKAAWYLAREIRNLKIAQGLLVVVEQTDG
jgi:hypothetical protein